MAPAYLQEEVFHEVATHDAFGDVELRLLEEALSGVKSLARFCGAHLFRSRVAVGFSLLLTLDVVRQLLAKCSHGVPFS